MQEKNLVIDANLLLLLIIGALDDGIHISRSKRLNSFSLNDFDVLTTFLIGYRVHITPYVAAEVSNLIDFRGELRDRTFAIARILLSKFNQIDTVISDDVSTRCFITHGITDASLVTLSENYKILTNDERMLIELYKVGGDNILPFYLLKQDN